MKEEKKDEKEKKKRWLGEAKTFYERGNLCLPVLLIREVIIQLIPQDNSKPTNELASEDRKEERKNKRRREKEQEKKR